MDQLFWNFEQDISCNQCLEPIYTPQSLGNYSLSITDSESQCADSIQFLIESCSANAFLPNVFSLNGENINDEFILVANKCITVINSVKIFDRWGGLIHENKTSDITDMIWDGYSDSSFTSTVVYVYLIELTFLDGSIKVLSGDILLLR